MPECGSGDWILSPDDPEQVFVKVCQSCLWVWDLEEMWHTCEGGDCGGDGGIPHATVQALVGHESAAVSQRYTHVGMEALQRAAASLPVL